MGEGEGREEESCLIYIEVIGPRSRFECGGFLFFSGPESDPPQKHRDTSHRRSEVYEEACSLGCGKSVGCGKSRNSEGCEEAVAKVR